MGLFERLRATPRPPANLHNKPQTPATAVAFRHIGDEDLEVVGEAHHQDALWSLCGGVKGDRIRCAIVAVLVPEPENPYDPNAIAVYINGNLVGYLARDVAANYLPGLHAAMARCGGYVALDGVIVGGGYYDDGPGRLGVWLEHDPSDFGLNPGGARRSAVTATLGQGPANGTMRTGFTEAWRTDLDDDSYDLSWFNGLPNGDRPAIAMLRELLSTYSDPIDRHFQFAELESRLYHSRDLYTEALEEFDETCRLHDAEMDAICQAFLAKWQKVPLLETYRQMAIRQQKAKNWKACIWWAERGLALYGNSAAREDAVEDLLKRRNRALAKLEASVSSPQRRVGKAALPTSARASNGIPQPTVRVTPEAEVLVCSRCSGSFQRLRVRGRKPLLCPACRSSSDGA